MRSTISLVLLLVLLIGWAACALPANADPPSPQQQTLAGKFDRLDRNGNGSLDFNEFRRQLNSKNPFIVEALRRRFQSLCGPDNRIDQAEFTGQAKVKPVLVTGFLDYPYTDLVVDVYDTDNTIEVVVYASPASGEAEYYIYYAKTYDFGDTSWEDVVDPSMEGEYIGEGKNGDYLKNTVTESSGSDTYSSLVKRRLVVWQGFVEDGEDPEGSDWSRIWCFFYPHAPVEP